MTLHDHNIQFASKLAMTLICKNQKLGHLFVLSSIIIPLSLYLKEANLYYQGLFIASNVYLVSLLSYDSDETTEYFYRIHSVSKALIHFTKAVIILSIIIIQTAYLIIVTPWPVYMSNLALFFTLYLTFSHTAYVLNGILSLGLALTSLLLSTIAIFMLSMALPTYASCLVWIVNAVVLLSYLYYQLKRHASQVY